MTVGEYVRNNHACPYCGSTDYYVFNEGVICTIYKCMACHRKMWEYEVLFEQEEPITEETATDDVCCENRLMVTKKKHDDLLEKHLSECRQIAKYDAEIKKLKDENTKLKQIIDDRNKNMVINEQ
jgi:DNA-directed RNA polymerase subunit RPC12/RpoP